MVMKNVCDYCNKQKNRKPESWLCVKYGIVLHQPRIYCVSKEDKPRDEIPQPGIRYAGREV